MRNFNSNNRFSGNRDFNRRNSGGRDFDRPMYKAVCDRCGKDCELPFKPTGSRPVYCNDCFKQSNGQDSNSRGFENRNYQAPRYERKFEPKQEFTPKDNNSFQYKQQFEALNAKLDKIIKLMTPDTFTPLTESAQENKETDTKKPAKKEKKKSKV